MKTWHRGAAILTGIYITRMLGMFMLFPVFSLYAQNLEHATPSLIGVALGAYGLSQGLLQIPLGYWSDKFGRKPLICGGLFIFSVGSLMAAFTNDIYVMIIARLIQGMGAVSAVTLAYASEISPADKLGKVMAIIGASIGLTFVLSLVVAPLFLEYFGGRGLFFFLASLSLVACAASLFLPSTQTKVSSKIIDDKQSLAIICAAVFLLHFLFTGAFVVLPSFLKEFELSQAKITWFLYLPTNILALKFMYRGKHSPQLLNFGFDYWLLAFGFILISASFSFWFLIMAMAVFFTAFYRLETGLPHFVATIASPENRGTAMGYFTTSQFIGSFIGGSVSGILWKAYSPNIVLSALAIIAGLGGLILMKLGKNKRSY